MKLLRTRLYWTWAAVCVSVFFAAIAVLALLLVIATPEAQRDAARTVLADAAPVLVYAALLLALGLGAAVYWVVDRYPAALRRLAQQAGALFLAQAPQGVSTRGAPEVAAIAAVLNQLAARWRATEADIAARTAEGAARLREERDQLAALLSGLNEGVIVCNAQGRVLLYNARAQALLCPDTVQASQAPLGLGRSVFGHFDREQVVHALEKAQRGTDAQAPRPQSRFVVAIAGRPLRVNIAPFVSAAGEVAGMVFTFDEAREAFGAESPGARLLRALELALEGPLARLQTATRRLQAEPAAAALRDSDAVAHVAAEAQELQRQLRAGMRDVSESAASTLLLDDVRAADLLAISEARLHAAGLTVSCDDVAADLWLHVDSFMIVQTIVALAGRVREDYAIRHFRLRAARQEHAAALDVVWSGTVMASEVLPSWQDEPLSARTNALPLTLRQVMQRHGGDVVYQADRPRQEAWIRLLLPVGEATGSQVPAAPPPGSRPEFYDFDLVQDGGVDVEMAQRPLASLAFTVFDTETTGLQPSAGDEIIAIGAARIVNGRLLRQEVFDQLVDPRRPIDRTAKRVHGIGSETLAGQPTIDEVLPRFHRFCEDTVLVAHNAAFDLRFFALKEQSAGVRFDQPVLDTLLLSAIVFPHEDSHDLEVLAARLGVPVLGRHTALGDALVTAEILLRLLPMLKQAGNATLGQALDASRATRLARLQY